MLEDGNEGHRPYDTDRMTLFYGTDGLQHLTSHTYKPFCGIVRRPTQKIEAITIWAAIDIIQQGDVCKECLYEAVRRDRKTTIAYTKWLLDE